jgi:hypothetical protein
MQQPTADEKRGIEHAIGLIGRFFDIHNHSDGTRFAPVSLAIKDSRAEQIPVAAFALTHL